MTDTTTTSPPELAERVEEFGRLFAAGDLEALAELYTEDAVLVWAPGARVQGRAAVRAAFEDMHRQGARMTLQPRTGHVVGDVAVHSSIATLTGSTPDGEPLVTTTTEVLRRGADGQWRFAIDDPFFSG